jgi:hypothetical protein
MRIEKFAIALSLLVWPIVSFAVSLPDDTNHAPEPETLGLLAGAAVAWAIVRWRNRK